MSNLPRNMVSFLFILIFVVEFVSPGMALARHRTNTLEGKINDLDNDKVDELPLPLLFGTTPDNITRNFGDPRSGGRTHEGLDIMAPRGTPVASPTEAVVTRKADGESSGLYITTANPGGESMVYMHLDSFAEIKEGDVLEVGEIIGYVGSTGNAQYSSPHLHFEIHSSDGKAIDPFSRLTRIFILKDKILALEQALEEISDDNEKNKFINFVITKYRSDFILAKSLNIELPQEIEDGLVNLPKVNTVVTQTINQVMPSIDLKLGSGGSAVRDLQKFLMNQNIALANSIVADGNFGLITQKALAQYQTLVGISPASGYYGSITRAYIAKNT